MKDMTGSVGDWNVMGTRYYTAIGVSFLEKVETWVSFRRT